MTTTKKTARKKTYAKPKKPKVWTRPKPRERTPIEKAAFDAGRRTGRSEIIESIVTTGAILLEMAFKAFAAPASKAKPAPRVEVRPSTPSPTAAWATKPSCADCMELLGRNITKPCIRCERERIV